MLKQGCAKLRPALALTASLFLTGCATANFECPIPKDYSLEFQIQVADELDQMPGGSAAAVFIADYGVMRAEARACRGEP